MKSYDRAYFDRWYHDPQSRIHRRTALERKVHLALSATEYLIGHPVRTVLDIGCGEAPWRAVLRKLRPGLRYTGVDSSLYAVKRFGRTRGIRLGTFGTLGQLGIEGPFDLVVCSDVLHYVPSAELKPGVTALSGLLGGLAWIEVFTAADSITGDFREMKRRAPAEYERLFRSAGLVHCGLCCFVRADFGPGLTAFERGRR